MPKYKYQGYEYSEEEIISAAEQNNLNLEDYINKYDIEIVPDKVESVDFQTGPVKETAVAGPMTEAQQQAVDTVSVLEDTSLDLPPVETFSIDGKEVTQKAETKKTTKSKTKTKTKKKKT